MGQISSNQPRTRRTSWGLRAALPGIGAFIAVALMAMVPAASAAAASAATFHAKPVIEDELGLQGCAKGKVPKPTINLVSGIGKAYARGQSKTCPASSGGIGQISESVGYLELGATEALKLTKPASLVNITYNVSALAADSAVGTFVPSQCPWQNISGPSVTFFANGSTAAGYLNLSQSFCEVVSLWEMYMQPLVFDVTTSTYTYGAFGFAFNESGSEYQNFSETINYTSPGYWSSNYSYHNAGNVSFGSGGSGITTMSGSNLISGSWAKGDKLLIEAYVVVIAETEVYFASHATAKVLWDASTGANHVDLKSITVS